jgi:hypothetical protein
VENCSNEKRAAITPAALFILVLHQLRAFAVMKILRKLCHQALTVLE